MNTGKAVVVVGVVGLVWGTVEGGDGTVTNGSSLTEMFEM